MNDTRKQCIDPGKEPDRSDSQDGNRTSKKSQKKDPQRSSWSQEEMDKAQPYPIPEIPDDNSA